MSRYIERYTGAHGNSNDHSTRWFGELVCCFLYLLRVVRSKQLARVRTPCWMFITGRMKHKNWWLSFQFSCNRISNFRHGSVIKEKDKGRTWNIWNLIALQTSTLCVTNISGYFTERLLHWIWHRSRQILKVRSYWLDAGMIKQSRRRQIWAEVSTYLLNKF